MSKEEFYETESQGKNLCRVLICTVFSTKSAEKHVQPSDMRADSKGAIEIDLKWVDFKILSYQTTQKVQGFRLYARIK